MEQQQSQSLRHSKSGKFTTESRLVPRDISESLGRIPPQALDLEEAVLGAMLLERNAVMLVIDSLHADDFYTEPHREIFQAIVDLYKDGKPVDMRTVVNMLRKNGRLEVVGGAYFIAELTSRVSSAANIEYHSRIIMEYSMRRKLIQMTSQYSHDAYDDTIDIFNLLEKYDRQLGDTINPYLKGNLKTVKSVMTDTLNTMMNRKKNHGLTGVPSGFTAFDRVTAGWQNSDLIIIAGRPGMGKTAFVVCASLNAAVRFGYSVLVFSLEMSAMNLGDRIASSEAEVALEDIRRSNLTPTMYDDMLKRTRAVVESKLFIDDSPALNIFELRAKAKRAKNEHNIQIIVVDYLQLMKGDTRGNREQEISSISSGLKQLAKELNVPVIALSALGRGAETRGGDKRPQLSDLRESGAIEQDADIVVFLYRPEYYGITEDDKGFSTKGVMEAIVAKHRQGSLDNVPLKFTGKYTKVSDYNDVPDTFRKIVDGKVTDARKPYKDDDKPASPNSTDDLPF